MKPRLDARVLYDMFTRHGIEYYYGVPDSITGPFSRFLTKECDSQKHIIAANEGNAIGMGIGSYAATGKTPVVYMQNSGLGNATDPLVSLVDKAVYKLPMILCIGWRGQPGSSDEPQHVKQGEITLSSLDLLQIPYEILSTTVGIAEGQINCAIRYTERKHRPYALVIPKDTFNEESEAQRSVGAMLLREDALRSILQDVHNPSDIIVSGIGKISRELYELSDGRSTNRAELYVVGGMGHTSSVALTVSLAMPDSTVYCLDGDGSVLMHMGSLATIGNAKPKNLIHIVFNNGVHDSVGAMPTTAPKADIKAVASGCGYEFALSAISSEDIRDAMREARQKNGPIFLEIKVRPGSRKDLGRPEQVPSENLRRFMSAINTYGQQ